jgi:hypothetical protein
MSMYDLMAAYQLETGLPPLGLHRALADHVVQRFAVTCESCKGTGAQHLFGEPVNCTDCRGWRKHLSPAAVRRLHQIVTAAFPAIRAGCATENTVQRWATRKSVPATRPMYLGVAPLPESVPQAPVETALTVCSLAWRRGLRSEFLWSGGNACPCVLWERLPDLTHHDGAPWYEVFAWTNVGSMGPSRSALRLLQRGWASENFAYNWLAAPLRLSQLCSQKAFSVTSAGIVSEQQIEWVFLAAARARSLEARRGAMVAMTKRSRAGTTRNIGSYPFAARSSNRKAAERKDICEGFIAPPDRVISAEDFASRRERRRRLEIRDGDPK